jgi:hypothetical protein
MVVAYDRISSSELKNVDFKEFCILQLPISCVFRFVKVSKKTGELMSCGVWPITIV